MPEMKLLTMPIKKKWFDLIKSGEKTVEYRAYSPYWKARFRYDLGFPYTHIRFRNGYRKDSPSFIIKIERVDLINGETELMSGCQYAIELGKIMEG